MWYGLLVSLFVILCILLVLIILIQKTKGGMGIGSMGGGTQMLFGGSGGQDLFQKITWVMTALFMGISLLLAVIKKPTTSGLLSGLSQAQTAQQARAEMQTHAAQQTASAQPVQAPSAQVATQADQAQPAQATQTAAEAKPAAAA